MTPTLNDVENRRDVDAFYRMLAHEKETDAEMVQVVNTEFTNNVGCSMDIMKIIDKMYADAKKTYDARVLALDADFAAIKAKRDAFFKTIVTKLQESHDSSALLTKQLSSISMCTKTSSTCTPMATLVMDSCIDIIKDKVDTNNAYMEEDAKTLRAIYTKERAYLNTVLPSVVTDQMEKFAKLKDVDGECLTQTPNNVILYRGFACIDENSEESTGKGTIMIDTPLSYCLDCQYSKV